MRNSENERNISFARRQVRNHMTQGDLRMAVIHLNRLLLAIYVCAKKGASEGVQSSS